MTNKTGKNNYIPTHKPTPWLNPCKRTPWLVEISIHSKNSRRRHAARMKWHAIGSHRLEEDAIESAELARYSLPLEQRKYLKVRVTYWLSKTKRISPRKYNPQVVYYDDDTIYYHKIKPKELV